MSHQTLNHVLGVCFFFALAIESSHVSRADELDKSIENNGIINSVDDFPWWRGNARNGQGNPSQDPPTTWSATKNIHWRTPIPGRGHGSPTIVGDRVLVPTANLKSDRQSVYCFDRETGAQLWKCVVHTGGLMTKGNKKQNKKASLASSTVASDGRRLFINFLNGEAVWTSAISFDGDILWQRKICDYVVHQGYGSSPAIYNDLVIVSADNKGGGSVQGLDRATGEVRWQHARPKKPNYSSPIILYGNKKPQLVLTGCDLVTSLDPATGELLWEVPGATTECVTSPVSDGKVFITSGGYPKNHISAVAADGSGKLVWENKDRAYVPSLLYRSGYLYAVLDAGVAVCFDVEDGSQQWKARLGGTFSSSPLMVGNKIYATNENGETFVFAVNPEKYIAISKNKLGDSVFASPSICGNRIYLRVAEMEDGERNEFLYCIGKD